jgi:hypothetical protein
VQGEINQLDVNRKVHRAPEQLAHQRTFGLIEAPERVVIGPLKAGQPQQSDALRTGALQLTAAAHSCHESVEPACKQMLGPVAGPALYRRFQLEAERGQIELSHEFGDEAGRMIGGNQIVKRGGKQKGLIARHR